MTFSAPLALLLLLPWTAIAAWTLFGQADFAWVSFVRLWPRSAADAPPRRKLTRPPLPILLLLLAMLAALLAAAGLGVRGAGTTPFTLIVDRGLATAAALAGGAAFDAACAELADATPVTWVDVATSQTDERSLASARVSLRSIRPTAVDTGERLPQVVRRVLAERDGPVVVVSVESPTTRDPRVRWWRPPGAVANAGIEHFAITTGERPQAMVRVYNATAVREASLRVADVERTIELPASGQSRDYFVDLPPPDEAVTAELRIDDAIAADNVAYAARSSAWPRIEAAAALPPALARLVRVYTEARPPAADGRVVTITTDPAFAGRAVFLATGEAAATPAGGGAVDVIPHPITRDVDWQRLLPGPAGGPTGTPSSSAKPQAAVPGGDWRPVVTVGGVAVVAVRETPHRQVWVGLDPSAGVATAAYVVLWTAVLDHLGDGPTTYASQPPREPPPAWRRQTPTLPIDAAPGLFTTPDGPRATTVPAVRVPPSPGENKPLVLPPGVLPLRRGLLIVAVAAVVAAVAFQRRTSGPSPGRGGT